MVGAMIEKPGEPGRYLITQRSAKATLPLLWEFPGGKAHDGEVEAAALARELKERLALDVEVGDQQMATHHSYASHELVFTVFACTLRDRNQAVSHAKVNDHRWVSLEQMSEYEFPGADQKTLEKLLDLEDDALEGES